MKQQMCVKVLTAVAAFAVFEARCDLAVATAKEPIDYVNTGIGSVSHMLVPTFRTVQRPNAMFRFNGPAGQFTEDKVGRCHLFVPGHRDPGVFPFYPKSGDAKAAWSGTWDQEHATPYSYDVYFDGEGVKMSVAPGEKAGLFVFDFERPGPHALVFSTKDRARGRITIAGTTLDALDVFGNHREDVFADVFLRGAFDCAPTAVIAEKDRTIVSFPETPCTVRLRLAFSYIDGEQAARTLAAEMPDFDLRRVAAAARAVWNRTLGQIELEGGTEDEKTVFYTALWRTYERMVNVTEEGRYRGFDKQVHETKGADYYVDDWTWDTYRAAHPLMTILRPKAEGDKLQSYVRMGRENKEGWMPVFPGIAGDRHSMVNRHPSVMMLDAWRKGIRNFDAKQAFAIIDHTEETESLVPWYRGPLTELDRFYKEHGYYPGLPTNVTEWVEGVDTRWERRQCVSVTQGAALDAWAIAEFGRELGLGPERLDKYDRRAAGYRQLWNPKTQFFHPKDATGNFVEPFDYMLCGGDGARHYFTENNAWTYIWDVQHDIPGLVSHFGGPARMEAKLDKMLNTSVGAKWRFTGQMPDSCTGLMGVFTMANEPSFHIPYLYNYCGKPEKTQKFVRKTIEAWFRNDRMGMCGDEDGGGMSAYAVFSMLGFYPVTPGQPEYQWGSPVFRKVTIHLENGKDFVLEAPAASDDAKYVRSISVDGFRTRGACSPLKHADIVRGAKVLVEMATRPAVDAAESAPVREVTVDVENGDETRKIQSAIDRVWQAGGGCVVVAPGVHRIGGIRLRSNVNLHLQANAVLLGSRDCADYDILENDSLEPLPRRFFDETRAVQNSTKPRDRKQPWIGAVNPTFPWNDGLIRLVNATNVVLSGEAGCAIDGQNSYNPRGEERYRGVHGISCFHSTNVVVRGVELRNTGNWATRFAHSADLVFENLTIRGGHDGVHVRGCDRVHVKGCDIRCGDDSIAGFDNYDVVVENCSLNTACSAFRFGGTKVRVRRCHIWGPAEWPFRNPLSTEEKRLGVSSQGRGRANLLSLWTYFADFSQPIRRQPGDIVVSDCVVENADRVLMYDFSGSQIWQQGAPLADITFERVRVTGVRESLVAYGVADCPLKLTLKDCSIVFAKPVKEFVRGASVGSIALEGVCVEGVAGPCLRSWKGEAKIELERTTGIENRIEPADKPFRLRNL